MVAPRGGRCSSCLVASHCSHAKETEARAVGLKQTSVIHTPF